MMRLILITLLLTPSLWAAPKAKAKAQDRPKYGTDHHFDNTAVQGRYQYAAEGVATVEDEKILDDLLGVRTHFKDRLKKQAKE